MKIVFSEYHNNYATYTFSYAVYAIGEAGDRLSHFYEKGFLPYTGDVTVAATTYYLARSVRVNLEKFSDSSENRRVARKLAELDLSFEIFRKDDFDTKDEGFRKLCLGCAAQRFVGNEMNGERLDYVLSRDAATHIWAFMSKERPIGYLITGMDDQSLHYWFAFFEPSLMKQYPVGKWMMWRAIAYAKENNLRYVYLGTAYGPKALYKVRDFKGIEFFDGTGWNPDTALLKSLCKDEAKREVDRLKESGDWEVLLSEEETP